MRFISTMPLVKFDRIVSCSSEDSAHPSNNLLLSRDYCRKWKCKDPGQERASVIIQLSEPYIISGIDIGNESSSFVEVLVSRTSTPDDFEVLLVMSSFMTPMDARSETNRNRVRMFSHESLSESVRNDKWDRIKVVCSQPFNKHLQFGLCFIVLHTNESKQQAPLRLKSPSKALGRFALKDEDESDISVGTFFSRRKDLQESSPRPAPLSGAAAVRDASSHANLAEQNASNKRKGSDDVTDSQKKKRVRPKKDASDSPSSNNVQTNTKKDESPLQINHKAKRNSTSQSSDDKSATEFYQRSSANDVTTAKTSSDRSKGNAGPSSSTQSSSQGNQLNQKHPQIGGGNVIYKPFNKLLEGVEIVLSGYENPGRAHIRDKAIQMGSRYNGNWSSSSTHLICAFTNTPKYRQVQGKGIIVTHEWIDDCFRERKKLSWRRYATDKNERKVANCTPETEVWELLPDNSPLPPGSRRNDVATQDTRLQSDSDDSETEIERIKAKQTLKNKKLEEKINKDLNFTSFNSEKKKGSCSSDLEDVTNSMEAKHLEKKKLDESTKGCGVKLTGKQDDQSDDNEAYNCSTDVDSEGEAEMRIAEWSKERKMAWLKEKLPPLPDFFKEKKFYIARGLSETERHSLSRYIVAFGGEVLQSDDESAHYIVSNEKCKVPEGSRSIFVTPDWIWECNDRQRIIPAILYEPD